MPCRNAVKRKECDRPQAHRGPVASSTEMDRRYDLGGPVRPSPEAGDEIEGERKEGRASGAIVIRSELNRRSEFQRVSCRLVAARMQMAMARSRGQKTGGRRRRRDATDVMYRRRYVSECNHRNGTRVRRRRVAPERGTGRS